MRSRFEPPSRRSVIIFIWHLFGFVRYDQRPTTNDQRPTTNDQQGGTGNKHRECNQCKRFGLLACREMDRIYVDEETGEIISLPVTEYEVRRHVIAVNNAETGEPEMNLLGTNTVKTRRMRFQIPKEVKETLSTKDGSKKTSENLKESEPVPVGTCFFGQIHPTCVFLLAIVCFRWFLTVIVVLEVAFHIWAHRKNKSLRNANVYFRSPFHAISSEFCAICQNETCMDRVGKMQQIRMQRFLRQCDYMKRIVT